MLAFDMEPAPLQTSGIAILLQWFSVLIGENTENHFMCYFPAGS